MLPGQPDEIRAALAMLTTAELADWLESVVRGVEERAANFADTRNVVRLPTAVVGATINLSTDAAWVARQLREHVERLRQARGAGGVLVAPTRRPTEVVARL